MEICNPNACVDTTHEYATKQKTLDGCDVIPEEEACASRDLEDRKWESSAAQAHTEWNFKQLVWFVREFFKFQDSDLQWPGCCNGTDQQKLDPTKTLC